MSPETVLFISVLYVLSWGMFSMARAEINMWRDGEGNYHITDDISKMPLESSKKSEAEVQITETEPSRSDRNFDELVRALKSHESAEAAALELASLKDERAVDSLIELLYRSGFKWHKGKHAALQALVQIKTPRAINGLISALDDTEISYYITKALVDMNEPLVTDVLSATVCDEKEFPLIIHESGKVLATMGTRGATALLANLQNKQCACTKINNCSGRGTIVYYLGKMKDRRATAPLVEMLNEHIIDKYVTNSMHSLVAESLKEITGQNFGCDYRSWIKWLNNAETVQDSSSITTTVTHLE